MMVPAWIIEAWKEGGKARIRLGGTALLLLGLLVTVFIASLEQNDMDIFLQAARDMLAGRNMYLLKYNQWYSYFYSPFFALLIWPLTLIAAPAAKMIWGLLIIALALRISLLLDRWLGLKAVLPSQRALFHFLLLLFLFQTLRDNINSMQVTPLLVWLCLEGVRLIREERPFLGAALLALGMDMKLLPMVLLPYLVWRGHWKAAVMAVALFAALQVLPAAVLGWDMLMELHHTRASLLDPSDPRHILDEEEPSFISLGSLLSAYLSTEGGSSNTLALPRTIAALPLEAIRTLLLVGRLLLIALTLYFLRWPPFRKAPDSSSMVWEISYLLLCTVLLFPHQRNYSLFLVAPAVAWLIFGRMRLLNSSRAWTIALVIVLLGLNAELLLGAFANVYAHYKLKSFIVIMLIGLLIAMAPWRLRSALKTDDSALSP